MLKSFLLFLKQLVIDAIKDACAADGPIYDQRPASHQLHTGTWVAMACWMVVSHSASGGPDFLGFIVPNQVG